MVYIVVRKRNNVKYYYVVKSYRDKTGMPVHEKEIFLGSEKEVLEKLGIKIEP